MENKENGTSDRTHWKLLTNPNYIGAYTLAADGKDLVVEIIKVQRERVQGTDGKQEECTVAHLQGQKPLILNKTNCKIIEKIYGTPFIEEWTGKKITLYVANVRAFGDVVPALRIRDKVPSVIKGKFTPEHPKWAGAIAALKAGSVTIQAIEKTYSLSTTNKQLLIDAAI